MYFSAHRPTVTVSLPVGLNYTQAHCIPFGACNLVSCSIHDVRDAAARKNRLHHVVSDSRGTANTPVKVCQDSSIFVSELDPATTVK